MSINPKNPVSILLFVWLAMASHAASTSGNDQISAAPDLYCEFVPVPPGQNAIIEWRLADAQRTPLNTRENEMIQYSWKPGARPPAAADLADLQNWLRKNHAALDLVADSLNKPAAQWPERDSSIHQPEITAFAQLIKGRLFEADQLADQGKFAAAAQSLQESLKLAQEGVDGDPQLIQYHVAGNARTQIQDAMLRLAARKAVPESILLDLLTNLPSLNQETNTYDHILRLEFAQEMNRRTGSKAYAQILADTWTKPVATNLLAFYPKECWRPLRVLLDPSLVSAHPNPIDFNVEIARSARHYRNYRTNSVSKWADRVEVAEFDRMETESNLLAEIQPLMDMVKNEPLPLSHRAAQNAMGLYLQIQNPVGRILDCSYMSVAWDDSKVFRNRTEREATRAVLALLIFERRKGVLPGKLSDLVDENILKSVPTDLFAAAPLHYSRDRHVIWSVGLDGHDDNAAASNTRWGSDDAVWQIPELN